MNLSNALTTCRPLSSSFLHLVVTSAVLTCGSLAGQQGPVQKTGSVKNSRYVLGSGDQVAVFAVDAEELSGKVFRIDSGGYVSVPLAGSIEASGLSTPELEVALTERLKKYIREPLVRVTVTETRSQPVSILGAVAVPGVHQLQSDTTLVDILSEAGGLTKDAGYQIKITRRAEWGLIPLSNARMDATQKYSTAEVNAKDLSEGNTPTNNILILPNDVITVPKASLVYVIGHVKRAGGFTMGDRSSISVLQALALAEGPDSTALLSKARVLREGPGASREQIPVNLSSLLVGGSADMPLLPNDVLFVPDNATKRAAMRVAEVTLQTLASLVIWRGL